MNSIRSKMPAIIVGVLAIAVGVGYGLKAFGVIPEFTVFIDGWWTIFIILPGLFSLFHRDANKMVGLLLIALGIGLFLHQQHILSMNLVQLIVPALIILFGIGVIMSAFGVGKRKSETEIIYSNDGSLPEYEVAFGEVSPNYTGKNFTGCHMDVSFGKATLDLRQAIIESDCTIEVKGAFSGIEIILPPSCKLEVQSTSDFGGVENQFTSTADESAYTIHLKADVNFGGLVIR